MTRPDGEPANTEPEECSTCGGSAEVYGEEPPGWWHGSGVFTPCWPCPDCAGTGALG